MLDRLEVLIRSDLIARISFNPADSLSRSKFSLLKILKHVKNGVYTFIKEPKTHKEVFGGELCRNSRPQSLLE